MNRATHRRYLSLSIIPVIGLLLAPFAPYLSSELWEQIGCRGNLLRAPWPKFNESHICPEFNQLLTNLPITQLPNPIGSG